MGQMLDSILSPTNLRAAWNAVAENEGMPGVDNLSIRRWRRTWEERLVRLAQEVHSGEYRPSRLRRRRIPKRRPGEWRTLRIPTVTDRVLQRAVYQILCPRFERIFLPCSYGYRPGRGLREAVQSIVAYRAEGFDWALDADIDAFFDRVDHAILLLQLAEEIEDGDILTLVGSWLQIGQPHPDEPVGIAMGSPLSPLLANIYLHPLDRFLAYRRWRLVRYADDFVVLTVDRTQAQRAREATGECLATLRLRLEPQKTAVYSFDEGFEFLGVQFSRDAYHYSWQEKRIKVGGRRADWLFSRYGPSYS